MAPLGTDADLLHAHLDIIVDVLSHCDKQLWIEDTVMMLDRMNIKRDARDTAARSITLQELDNREDIARQPCSYPWILPNCCGARTFSPQRYLWRERRSQRLCSFARAFAVISL